MVKWLGDDFRTQVIPIQNPVGLYETTLRVWVGSLMIADIIFLAATVPDNDLLDKFAEVAYENHKRHIKRDLH